MPADVEDRICLEERRHGIVLARPFARSLALAVTGGLLAATGWPASLGGAALLAVAALLALAAVWRWQRTRLVVTPETLLVVHGTLRRRSAAVALRGVGVVELEQSLAGRLLGYGTLIAGDLEIPYVPRPHRLSAVLGELAQRGGAVRDRAG